MKAARMPPDRQGKDSGSPSIGLLREKSLHASLKDWYRRDGDHLEMKIDGYIVDIVRGDLLIELQTRNFSQIKSKLSSLVEAHRVRLVYPIAQEKWIVRTSGDGQAQVARRRSPKRGRVEHLFQELVSLPDLINHPNFSLEVLITREEEIWRDDGQGSWRRKGWSVGDRRLVEVVSSLRLETAEDFQGLLPEELAQPFTTQDLAKALGLPRRLAQKMAYCLRQMGVLEVEGKQKRAWLYKIRQDRSKIVGGKEKIMNSHFERSQR